MLVHENLSGIGAEDIEFADDEEDDEMQEVPETTSGKGPAKGKSTKAPDAKLEMMREENRRMELQNQAEQLKQSAMKLDMDMVKMKLMTKTEFRKKWGIA